MAHTLGALPVYASRPSLNITLNKLGLVRQLLANSNIAATANACRKVMNTPVITNSPALIYLLKYANDLLSKSFCFVDEWRIPCWGRHLWWASGSQQQVLRSPDCAFHYEFSHWRGIWTNACKMKRLFHGSILNLISPWLICSFSCLLSKRLVFWRKQLLKLTKTMDLIPKLLMLLARLVMR